MALNIRKVQYSPSKGGRQPCTVVRKDFMLSPGELELEATLDKQVRSLGGVNDKQARSLARGRQTG